MWKPDLKTVDARRICIIKPSALGDVVQTLPLLAVLRERFPRADVSWVINRELAELLEDHPHLDRVMPFHRRGTWQESIRFLRELRDRRFDLVLDMQGLFRSGVMTLATGAPVRVGLETAREGSRLTCNHIIPDSGKGVPAHLRYWRVAEALGMGERRPTLGIVLSESDQEWVSRKLRPHRGPLLAIHPGARWRTKQWPVAKFADVAIRAVRRFGFSVIVVGSRSEIDQAEQLTQSLKQAAPNASVSNFAGRTTLKQLAGLLARADVLLSTDSGPMHMAAGLGTPVVSVFTCTSPVRSGPAGRHNALVASDLPCAASYCKVCPQRGDLHMACMEEITADRVWRALDRLVKERQRAVQPA